MDTPEHETVLQNMGMIIERLELTKGLDKQLAIAFQSHKWSGLTSSPSAEELVRLAVWNIKQNEDNFYVFIGMLKDIGGMGKIVNLLKDKRKKYMYIPQQKFYRINKPYLYMCSSTITTLYCIYTQSNRSKKKQALSR